MMLQKIIFIMKHNIIGELEALSASPAFHGPPFQKVLNRLNYAFVNTIHDCLYLPLIFALIENELYYFVGFKLYLSVMLYTFFATFCHGLMFLDIYLY